MTVEPVIGLFGTCGNSTWRNAFIKVYQAKGIKYFNPQRTDWKHEHVAEENRHLMEDDIILFPVTSETCGVGSLGEIGFSVLESVRNLKTDRYVVILIDNECKDPKADAKALKESVNARVLVKSKIMGCLNNYKNVFLVENILDVLRVSLELHTHLLNINKIKKTYQRI